LTTPVRIKKNLKNNVYRLVDSIRVPDHENLMLRYQENRLSDIQRLRIAKREKHYAKAPRLASVLYQEDVSSFC
jgi:hypothetical protein